MRRAWAVAAVLNALAGGSLAQVPGVGDPAPDFSLRTLEGPAARLSDFRGRAVVVNFWASWCAPCRTELPELVSAYHANEARGLSVLAVNLTDQERRKEVRTFVRAAGMPFPVLLDERGRVRERYRLIAVPTTVFIDRMGTVQRIHPGPLTRKGLEDGLEVILGPTP